MLLFLAFVAGGVNFAFHSAAPEDGASRWVIAFAGLVFVGLLSFIPQKRP